MIQRDYKADLAIARKEIRRMGEEIATLKVQRALAIEGAGRSTGITVPNNDNFDFGDTGNFTITPRPGPDGMMMWTLVDHNKGAWNKIKKYLPRRWIVTVFDSKTHPYWKVTWGKLSLKLWNIKAFRVRRRNE